MAGYNGLSDFAHFKKVTLNFVFHSCTYEHDRVETQGYAYCHIWYTQTLKLTQSLTFKFRICTESKWLLSFIFVFYGYSHSGNVGWYPVGGSVLFHSSQKWHVLSRYFSLNYAVPDKMWFFLPYVHRDPCELTVWGPKRKKEKLMAPQKAMTLSCFHGIMITGFSPRHPATNTT